MEMIGSLIFRLLLVGSKEKTTSINDKMTSTKTPGNYDIFNKLLRQHDARFLPFSKYCSFTTVIFLSRSRKLEVFGFKGHILLFEFSINQSYISKALFPTGLALSGDQTDKRPDGNIMKRFCIIKKTQVNRLTFATSPLISTTWVGHNDFRDDRATECIKVASYTARSLLRRQSYRKCQLARFPGTEAYGRKGWFGRPSDKIKRAHALTISYIGRMLVGDIG
jgi:hypothetical protein